MTVTRTAKTALESIIERSDEAHGSVAGSILDLNAVLSDKGNSTDKRVQVTKVDMPGGPRYLVSRSVLVDRDEEIWQSRHFIIQVVYKTGEFYFFPLSNEQYESLDPRTLMPSGL